MGEKINARPGYRLLCQGCGLQESQRMPQGELAKAPDLEPSLPLQASTTLQPKTETWEVPFEGREHLQNF